MALAKAMQGRPRRQQNPGAITIAALGAVLALLTHISTSTSDNLCEESPCGFANATCSVANHTLNGTVVAYERVCGCQPGFALVFNSSSTSSSNTTTTTVTPMTETSTALNDTGRQPEIIVPNYDTATCSDIDACAFFPCALNAVCTDLPAPAGNTSEGRKCACKPGFHANGNSSDGTDCVEIDACASHPCHPNANCTDLPAPAPESPEGRTCKCNAGYAGDGVANCTNINACIGFPCHEFGVCADFPPPAPNSTEGRSCHCDWGYTGNGEDICFDVNACERNLCDVNANCTDLPPPAPNRPDGRTCTCHTGFVGDGEYCIGLPQLSLDMMSWPVHIGSRVRTAINVPVSGYAANLSVILHAHSNDSTSAQLALPSQLLSASVVNGTIRQTTPNLNGSNTDRNITGTGLVPSKQYELYPSTDSTDTASNSSIPFTVTQLNASALHLSFGLVSTQAPAAPPAIHIVAALSVLGEAEAGLLEQLPFTAAVVHGDLHPTPIALDAVAVVYHPRVDATFAPALIPAVNNARETATLQLTLVSDTTVHDLSARVVHVGSARVEFISAAFRITSGGLQETDNTTHANSTDHGTTTTTTYNITRLNSTEANSVTLVLALTANARSSGTVLWPTIHLSFVRWDPNNSSDSTVVVDANPIYNQIVRLSPESMQLPSVWARTTLSTTPCITESSDVQVLSTTHVSAAPGSTIFACTQIDGPVLRFDLALVLTLPVGLASAAAVTSNLHHLPSLTAHDSGQLQAHIRNGSAEDTVYLVMDDLLVNTSASSPLVLQTALRISTANALITAGNALSISVQDTTDDDALTSGEVDVLGDTQVSIGILEPALELAYTTDMDEHQRDLDAGDAITHRLTLKQRHWSSAPAHGICFTLTLSPALEFTAVQQLPPLNCTVQATPALGTTATDSEVALCCRDPLQLQNAAHAVVLSTVRADTAPLSSVHFHAKATYTSTSQHGNSTAFTLDDWLHEVVLLDDGVDHGNTTDTDPNPLAAAVLDESLLDVNTSSGVREYTAGVERNATRLLSIPLTPPDVQGQKDPLVISIADVPTPQEYCMTLALSAVFQRRLRYSIIDRVQLHVDMVFESTQPANWTLTPTRLFHPPSGFSRQLAAATSHSLRANTTIGRVTYEDTEVTGAMVGAMTALFRNATADTVGSATLCFQVQRHTVLDGETALEALEGATLQPLLNASLAEPSLGLAYLLPSGIEGWPAPQLSARPLPSPWFVVGATLSPSTGLLLTSTDNAETTTRDVSLHELITFEASVDLPHGEYNLTLFFDMDPYASSNAFLTDAGNMRLAQVPECLHNTTDVRAAHIAADNADRIVVDFGSIACVRGGGLGQLSENTMRVQLRTAVVDPDAALPVLEGRRRRFVSFTAQYTSAQGVNETDDVWVDVTVMQPKLDLLTWMHTEDPESEAGDIVTYMFYIAHNENSTAAAFDLQLHAQANIHHAYINNSLRCFEFCDPGTEETTVSRAGGDLIFTIPRLPLGRTVYWRWKATVRQSAPAGARLRSDYDFRFDTHPRNATAPVLGGVSLPGVEEGESVYHTMDVQRANFTGAPVFSSISTTREVPRYDLAPDELFTLNFTITLPASTTDSRVIVYLPTAYRALRGQVTALGFLIDNSSLAVGGLADLSSGGRRVEFDFGAVQRLIASEIDGAPSTAAELGKASALSMAVACHAKPSFFGDDYGLRNAEQLILARLKFESFAEDVEVNTTAREPQLLFSDPIDHHHDAGDTVTYALVFDHDNRTISADAYDFTLSYTFSQKLVPQNASAVACLVNTTQHFNAFAPVCVGDDNVNSSSTAVGTQLPLTLTHTGFQLYVHHLSPSKRIHIAMQAQVVQDVVPEDKLLNHMALQYDSSPEKASSPYPGKVYTVERNIKTVIANPHARYAVSTSSEPETTGNSLTIGEEATVDVVWRLPEGEMPGTTLTVSAPPRTTFLNATIVRVGRSISGSNVSPFQDYDGTSFAVLETDPASIYINYGDLSNTYNNTPTLQDDIHVRIRFVIDNEKDNALNAIIHVETRLMWQNGARWMDSKYGLKIAEPFMESSVSTPTVRPDARDRLTYTTLVQHSAVSTSPIYRALVVISTPPEVELLTQTINIDTGTVLSSVPLLNIINSSVFEISLKEMSVLPAADERLMVTYDVVVVDEIRADEDIIVKTHNSWWSTPTGFRHPGRARDGRDANATYFGEVSTHTNPARLNQVQIELHRSSLVDTIGTEVNVAEELVYLACITLLEGHTNVTLTVDLDIGLDFLNATVLSVGDDIQGSFLDEGALLNATRGGSGAAVVFTFGELVNAPTNDLDSGDVICIETSALIANIPENVNGKTLATEATLTTDVSQHATSRETVRIIEPAVTTNPISIEFLDLAPHETESGVVPVDAGDRVRYNISIRHLPESTSTSFDVFIETRLPEYTGVIIVNEGSLPASINTTVPGYVVWHLEKLTLEEESFSTSVTLRIGNGVIPAAEDLRCSVITTAHSSPLADNQDAKTFTSVATSDALAVRDVHDSMQLLGTSIAHTPNMQVAVHELATLQYRLQMPEGSIPSIAVVIDQPNDQSLRLHQVTLNLGASVSCESLPASVGGALGLGQVDLELQFNNCVNSYDNTENEDDVITITMVTVVQDAASTLQPNAALRFRLRSTSTNGRLEDRRTTQHDTVFRLRLPAPSMQLSAVSRNHVLPEDVLQYDAVIAQEGSHLAPMFNTTLAITVPASLEAPTVLVGIDGGEMREARFALQPTGGPVAGAGNASALLLVPLDTIAPDNTVAVRIYLEVGPSVMQGLAIAARANLTFDTSQGTELYPGRAYAVTQDFKTLYVAALELMQTLTSEHFPLEEEEVMQASVFEPLLLQHRVRVRGSYALTTTVQLPVGMQGTAEAEPYIHVSDCTTTSVGGHVLISADATTPGQMVQPAMVYNDETHALALTWGDVTNQETAEAHSKDDDIVYVCELHVRNRPWIGLDDLFFLHSQADYAAFTSDAEHTLRVSEPTVHVASALQSFSAPQTRVQAHDPVAFEFVVNNSRTDGAVPADAFGVHLLLTLPGADSLVIVDATPATTALSFLADTQEYQLSLPRLALGNVWTVRLLGDVSEDVPAGVSESHTAQLSWLSAEDETREAARLYAVEQPETWTMHVHHPNLTLAVHATRTAAEWLEASTSAVAVAGSAQGSDAPPPQEVTVGGGVWLTLELGLYAGLYSDLAAVLVLPDGLTMVSHRLDGAGPLVDVGAGPTASTDQNGRAVFAFGDVLAQDEATLLLNVFLHVEDDKETNFNGVVHTLTANLDYNTFTRRRLQYLALRVVHPLLLLTGGTSVVQADAGDTVVLTQYLQHTATSQAPAYDITVDVTVPRATELLNVTSLRTIARVDGGSGSMKQRIFEQHNTSSAVGLGVLNETDSLALTWTFVVLQSARPSSSLPYASVVSYRHGSLNTSRPEAVAMAPLNVAVPDVVLSAPAPNEGGRNTSIGVGETIFVAIDLLLPEGTAPVLVVDLEATTGCAITSATLLTSGHVTSATEAARVDVMQEDPELGPGRRQRRDDNANSTSSTTAPASHTSALFVFEGDESQGVTAVQARMVNMSNPGDNEQTPGDSLQLLVAVMVLDHEAIDTNTTVNVSASVSVPWSQDSVGVSPSYDIGEPEVQVETNWALDSDTGFLILTHRVHHANVSELDATNLHFHSNVTGTLIIAVSNFTNGTSWDLLASGEAITTHNVIEATDNSPYGASVCVTPTIEYTNAGSNRPRAYKREQSPTCFKLPSPATSLLSESLYLILMGVVCALLLGVLVFLALRERNRRRRGGASIRKLPKPAKVTVQPTSLIRRTASSKRRANGGADREYLALGENIVHEYAVPRGPLVKISDGLYAEIDQVLDTHEGEEEGDYYCTINPAFQGLYEDDGGLYVNGRLKLPDGTYMHMNRFFVNEDGKLRRKDRENASEDHVYDEIAEDNPVYAEIKDVFASGRKRPPMPVLRSADNENIGLRRVFRRQSDGTLVPCFFHGDGVLADGPYAQQHKVVTELGGYEDVNKFFSCNGPLLEPLYESARILHDNDEFAGAREAIYDFARSSLDGEYIETDATYDMGEAGSDPFYDVGRETFGDGGRGGDGGDDGDLDPVYALGNYGGEAYAGRAGVRGSNTNGDAVYDIGQDAEADADFEYDPTYDLGTAAETLAARSSAYDVRQEGLQPEPLYDVANRKHSHDAGRALDMGDPRRNGAGPTYDMAGLGQDASATLLFPPPPPAAFGARDADDATYDVGNEAGDGEDATYALGANDEEEDEQEGDQVQMGSASMRGAGAAAGEDPLYALGDDNDSADAPVIVIPEPPVTGEGEGAWASDMQPTTTQLGTSARSVHDHPGSTQQQEPEQSTIVYEPQPPRDDLYDVSPLNNNYAPDELYAREVAGSSSALAHSSNSSSSSSSSGHGQTRYNADDDDGEGLYSTANQLGLSNGASTISFAVSGRSTGDEVKRYDPPYESISAGEAEEYLRRAASGDATRDEETAGSGYPSLRARRGPNNTLIVRRRGSQEVEDVYSVIQKAAPPQRHGDDSNDNEEKQPPRHPPRQPPPRLSKASGAQIRQKSTISMEWDPN